MTRFLLAAVAWLLLVAPASHAQSGGEARDLALAALRLDFDRDGVTAPQDALAAKFKEACDRGYNPACRRNNWLSAAGVPDPKKALDVFTPSCEAGDQVACLVMGWSLDAVARTLPPDDRDRAWRKAARQLKSDCDGGFAPACNDYASYLYENKGVDSDPAPALRRWNTACDAGELASCTTLGRLYLSGGPGVTSNATVALKFANKACDGKYAAGCALLGQIQDKSWTAPVVDKFYGGLCDQGYRDACWRLARVYFDGIYPEPQPGRLQGLFERGCDLGHAESCFEAGRWSQDHGGDITQAAARFGRACALGDAGGCSAQVALILGGQVQGSVKDAFHAFDSACEQGESLPACKALALALLDGIQVPRDAERGRTLLGRVCTDERSDPQACAALAASYEEGVGGERDRTEASKYYRWACVGGELQSCQRRGELLTSDVGVRRDDHEALNMFQRACDGGLGLSCYEGGTILFEGTYVTRDLAGAQALFTKGCDLKEAKACFGLGQVDELGATGTPDMVGARSAYERGVTAGSLDSKRALARLLWEGYGGPKEHHRAKSLCREACQSGDAVACRGPAFLKDQVE
jgi:hypothetical protein